MDPTTWIIGIVASIIGGRTLLLLLPLEDHLRTKIRGLEIPVGLGAAFLLGMVLAGTVGPSPEARDEYIARLAALEYELARELQGERLALCKSQILANIEKRYPNEWVMEHLESAESHAQEICEQETEYLFQWESLGRPYRHQYPLI